MPAFAERPRHSSRSSIESRGIDDHDRVNFATTNALPSSEPPTDLVPETSSCILESTDEQLETVEDDDEGTEKAGDDCEKPLRVPSLVHRNGYLLETVFKAEDERFPLRFNYYHLGRRREFGSSIPFDFNKIRPPLLDDMVRESVILLPSKGIPVPAFHQTHLVDKLICFIHRYLDIPPFWEKMVAHYVLMTWVYDRFTAVPYLRLLSEHGTGKSRFLQVIGTLCYKSIICGGSVSVSSVFRLTDQWRGTLALDECDFNHSSEWTEIVRLLNCGYMAGLPAVRSESTGRSYTPRAFHVFGPKILAGRHRFDDSALESRCLTYTPEERVLRSDIPRQLPARFWDEALDLRNYLLGWRFENFDAIRVDESPLIHLDARLAQIGTPIYGVTKDSVFREDYLRFLSEFGREDRAERPHQTMSNYPAIYQGFIAKGIPESEILPRENVFTFNAWRALGRTVRRGEHGVKVLTFIERAGKETDKDTGERKMIRLAWTTTVFHISQTEALTGGGR